MKIKSITVLVISTLLAVFTATSVMAAEDEVNLSAFAQSAVAANPNDNDNNADQSSVDKDSPQDDNAVHRDENDDDDVAPDTATGDDY